MTAGERPADMGKTLNRDSFLDHLTVLNLMIGQCLNVLRILSWGSFTATDILMMYGPIFVPPDETVFRSPLSKPWCPPFTSSYKIIGTRVAGNFFFHSLNFLHGLLYGYMVEAEH